MEAEEILGIKSGSKLRFLGVSSLYATGCRLDRRLDAITLPVEQRTQVIDDGFHVVGGHLVSRSYAQKRSRHVHDSCFAKYARERRIVRAV